MFQKIKAMILKINGNEYLAEPKGNPDNELATHWQCSRCKNCASKVTSVSNFPSRSLCDFCLGEYQKFMGKEEV